MKRILITAIALTCVACAQMTPYWPKIEGAKDAKYNADVRECQTDTQLQSDFWAGWVEGQSTVSRTNTDQGKAAIDACMRQKGYHVVTS